MFWRIVDWPNWVKPEVLTSQTSKPINSFQHFLELYLIFAFPSELTTSYLKNVQRGFILLLLTNFCRKVTMNMTGPPQIECYIKLDSLKATLELLWFHLPIANLHLKNCTDLWLEIFKSTLFFLHPLSACIKNTLSDPVALEICDLRIWKLNWLITFPTMSKQKFTNHILRLLKLYLHAQNQLNSSILTCDIVDSGILQPN